MCLERIKDVREVEVVRELLNVMTSDEPSGTIEELSERLGLSTQRIDCAAWDLLDVVYMLKHGSICEEELEELEGPSGNKV